MSRPRAPSSPADSTARPRHWRRGAARLLTLMLMSGIAIALAVLSTQHAPSLDLSEAGRNSLHAQSLRLLSLLDRPVQVIGFARPHSPTARAMRQLTERYTRHSSHIQPRIVDPAQDPLLARSLNIKALGELWLLTETRRERVEALDEAAMSNALFRLLADERRVSAVLTGHGEPEIDGQARDALSAFFARATELGHTVRPLSLATGQKVPEDVDLLVLLPLRQPLLAHEQRAIQRYVEDGGNLLWLAEPGQVPGEHDGLHGLSRDLGLSFEDGVIIDPTSRVQGRPTPEFIVVSEYARHALFEDFSSNTVFVSSAAISWQAAPGWRVKGVASSALRSWLERGPLDRAVRFDAGQDLAGPLDLMVSLERQRPARQGEVASTQRVIACADVDFLSNAYLGLAANSALADRLLRWLSETDARLPIERIGATDLDFDPTNRERALVALGAPIALPLLMLLCATWLWRRQRR
ncbi:MAG: Gldg family protein [Gammaproteobacteria bacterium]|nr:Gldg family protein [Gammaproteobacteria bacterium]